MRSSAMSGSRDVELGEKCRQRLAPQLGQLRQGLHALGFCLLHLSSQAEQFFVFLGRQGFLTAPVDQGRVASLDLFRQSLVDLLQ